MQTPERLFGAIRSGYFGMSPLHKTRVRIDRRSGTLALNHRGPARPAACDVISVLTYDVTCAPAGRRRCPPRGGSWSG